jgi:hypothetical protein
MRAVLREGRPLVAGRVDEVPPLHHARMALRRVALRQDDVSADELRLKHVALLEK